MKDVIRPTAASSPAYLPSPAPRERAAPRAPVDPLWRSVLGMFLRRHRLAQGLTLAQVATQEHPQHGPAQRVHGRSRRGTLPRRG